MGDMTRNFSRSEFACKCGCGFDDIDAELVNRCQLLRDGLEAATGKAHVLIVNSGCRCAAWNAQKDGSLHSYHVTGQGVDLKSPGLFASELIRVALKIDSINNGGVGYYPPGPGNGKYGFVHLDRGKKRRWTRINGRYYPGYIEPEKLQELKDKGVLK